jgi:hypothetical protein
MKKAFADIKRADLILILAVFLLSACSLFLFSFPDGSKVKVSVNGSVYGEYPLSEDREVVITLPDGKFNVLVIEDGCAYIKEASCPDKICVKTARISGATQTIVCLPNRVSVVILD